MLLLRRFLVLQSLMLWQGGFLFYASFVVPVGTTLLGSAAEQGQVTREVTLWLNAAGWLCLLLLAWDLAATRRLAGFRLHAALWGVMLLTQVLLVILHPQMARIMDAGGEVIPPRPTFRPLHRTYLWVTTVQWLAALAYAALLLQRWRRQDASGAHARQA